MGVGTLVLAVRHERRRRSGVYAGISGEDASSEVLQMLTMSDYLADTALRGQIQLRLLNNAHRSDGDGSDSRGHVPGGGV